MTDPSLTAVADRYRVAIGAGTDAFAQLSASLFASEVNFRHDPPQPNDALMTRAELIAHESRINVGLDRGMPGHRRDDVDVSVSGDTVACRYVLRGVVTDGSTVEARMRHVYTFRDGRIHEFLLEVPAEDADELRRALASQAR